MSSCIEINGRDLTLFTTFLQKMKNLRLHGNGKRVHVGTLVKCVGSCLCMSFHRKRTWRPLKRLLGLLGAFWVPSGIVLGASWRPVGSGLGCLQCLLEACRERLVCLLGASLGPLGCLFGASWAPPGPRDLYGRQKGLN